MSVQDQLNRIEAMQIENNHLLESIREKLEHTTEINIETSRKIDSVPLSTREAAKMFGCHRDTFVKHARAQNIRPIGGWNRRGGQYQWFRSDVDHMLRRRDKSTEQQADMALLEIEELRRAI